MALRADTEFRVRNRRKQAWNGGYDEGNRKTVEYGARYMPDHCVGGECHERQDPAGQGCANRLVDPRKERLSRIQDSLLSGAVAQLIFVGNVRERREDGRRQ